MKNFQIQSSYNPSGDQPAAINKICEGIKNDTQDFETLGKVEGEPIP